MSLRTVFLAAALTLVACGPGQRMVLPEKSTPAVTRIALAFTVDPALIEAAQKAAGEQSSAGGAVGEIQKSVDDLRRQVVGKSVFERAGLTGGGDADQAAKAGAHMAALAEHLEAQLRADLVDKRIGLPAADAQADLRLVGTFRNSSTAGIDLDWQLVQKKAETVVAAGVAHETWFMGDISPFADQILVKLLGADVDAYASDDSPKPPRPGPTPPDGAPGSDTDGAHAWAVIVGVEKYREALPVASHAESDAQAFATYAQRTLGVPEAHIRTLLGPRAGLADLASALEEWLPRNAREPGGRVYFFFSGHGAPDPESGKAYLVPYDADPAYLKTRGLALERLYDALGELKNQQTFVFLDACFSGSGDRSVLAAGTRPLVPVKPVATVAGVVSLAASGPRETTGASRDGKHGLFTAHLLAALGGAADSDGDRTVTLDEAARYVTDKVSADARLDNREQTPSLTLPAGVRAKDLALVVGLRGR